LLRFLYPLVRSGRAYQFVISNHSKNVCPTHLVEPCPGLNPRCLVLSWPASGRSGLQRYAAFRSSQEKLKIFFLALPSFSASFKRAAKVQLLLLFPSSRQKKFFAFSAFPCYQARFLSKWAAKVSVLFRLFQLSLQNLFRGPQAEAKKQLICRIPYRASVWECKSVAFLLFLQVHPKRFLKICFGYLLPSTPVWY
jgi:hypothetical protein